MSTGVPIELSDRKHKKKLSKFLSSESSVANKFNVVIYFTSKCQDPEVSDKVYKAYADPIFLNLFESYDSYLQQKLKGKAHESEVFLYLEVLKKLISYNLHSLRKNLLNPDKFISMILHFLHPQNKPAVRLAMFQNVYLELLFSSHDEDLQSLLPYAIDLSPFFPADNIVLAYPLDLYKDIIPLVPKEEPSQSSADETIDFLNIFLSVFRKYPEKFEYWFGVFKKYFVVNLYPKVSKEIGLSSTDNVGFVKLCPAKLQEVVVCSLGECMKERKQQCNHLWTDPGNATLMLEMYRQGLIVPPGEIQKELLDSFFKVLFIDPVELPPEKLHAYRKFFIDPLPLIIRGDATGNADLELLLHLQRIFKHSVKIWLKLESDMRDKILMTCLKLATNLLKGEASPKEASALVEIVLYMWVHTQVLNKSQWDTLRYELGTILHRPEVIEKIQGKLLQMTYFMATEYFYGWEKYNRNYDRIQKCAKHSGYSVTPDQRKLETKKYETVVSINPWDATKATTIWLYLLDIFRLLNVTGDGGKQPPIGPAIHVEICRAMKKVIYSLLTAYELSDYKAEPDPEKTPHSFVQVFCPWLFETIIDLPDEYLLGKAVAMKALCRIFVRHSQDRYPASVWSRFFDTIRVGLTKYVDTPISWAIIDSTVPIFSLSIPGANILIPYYLYEISRLFMKEKNKTKSVNSPQPPTRVRERALLILASLVSFPRHFQDVPDIPLLESLDTSTPVVNLITTVSPSPSPSPSTVNIPLSTSTHETQVISDNGSEVLADDVVVEDRVEEESEDVTTENSEDVDSEEENKDNLKDEEEEEDKVDLAYLDKPNVYLMFGPSLKYVDLQKIITRLLHFSLAYDNEPKHVHNALSILGVLILEELHKDTPDKKYIEWELQRLLKQTFSPNYLTALRTLQTFSLFYSKFDSHDEYFMRHTIHYLCQNILENFFNVKEPKIAKIIVEHYNTLLILLCSVPPKFFDDRRLVRDIFCTIESALSQERRKKGGRTEPISENVFIPPEVIAEAQKLLMTLLNFMHNFPTNGHYDIMSTQGLSEVDREGVLFTTMNELFLYSHYDIPKETTEIPEDPVEALDQLLLSYLDPRAPGISPAHRRIALYFQSFLRNKITDGNNLLDLLADLIEYRAASPINPQEWKTEALAILSRYPLESFFPNHKETLSPFLQPSFADIALFNETTLAVIETITKESLISYYLEWKESDSFNLAKDTVARFTARDVTGAYSWDCNMIFDFPTHISRGEKINEEEETLDGELANTITEEGNHSLEEDAKSGLKRHMRNRFDAVSEGKHGSSFISDLGHLLTHIAETQTPDDPTVKQIPPSQFDNFLSEIDQVLIKLEQQQKEDQRIETQHIPQSVPASLPPPPITTGPFRQSRLFLSHTGSLSFSTRNLFKMINYDDSRFKRHLKEFDKVQGRTPIKVGLLYVAKGQDEESQIFKNDNPSDLYKEFVQGLAAIVDLKKHSGYAAALEKHKDVGNDLPYYATPWVELAFHEPVRMPNVDREEHLVMKKRHVGNDLIHVIWSEHELDYQTTTIVSQFNIAHVIIYPLRNGLFRVQIAQKPKVGFIGPIVHNMVLRKELLPDLCRQTVIFSNIEARGEAFEGPYEQRIKKLAESHQKWGIEQNFSLLVSKAL